MRQSLTASLSMLFMVAATLAATAPVTTGTAMTDTQTTGAAVAAVRDVATTGAVKAEPFPSGVKRVLVVKLNDEIINPVTTKFMIDGIARAEAEKIPVVLQIDTPGGLLQSTRELVKAILSSKVPVITYVYPNGSRAASAGVFITLAGNIAAMAPSTNIGAAHPVSIGGKWRGRDPEDRSTSAPSKLTSAPLNLQPFFPSPDEAPEPTENVMSEKIMNDTLAWIEGIARLRGRNVEWARAAVTRSESITAGKAVEMRVVNLIAEDLDDLLRKIDGQTVTVAERRYTLRTAGAATESVELSTRQRILNILANPNIAYVLLLLGFAGLMYEITHPGLIVPGIAGAVCLLLAAFAFNMLPTNYVAVLMIMAGIALIIAEIKFTSYGLLTLAGAICLFFGSLALIEQKDPFIGVSIYVIFPVVIGTVLVLGILVILVIRAHSRPAAVGVQSMVGEIGEVARELDPEGKVFINGEYWNAVSAAPLAKGTRVRVVAVRKHMTLLVEPDSR